jgi:all-trans-retinol dehydrogenase (NAD+)
MPAPTPQLVLITGAARGIGKGLARRFIQRGDKVVGLDIDAEQLSLAADEFGAFFIPQRIDLSDAGDIKAVFERILEQHGPADILINNAGIVAGKYLLEHSSADIRRSFAINVESHFHTTRAVLPGMIERKKGHIVTVASAAGMAATSRMSAYSASKFAAVGFDDALRIELGKQGHPIQTTLVAPFYINTGMFDGVKTRFSWLLPILDQDYVADRIFNAIRKKKRRLIMPRFVYLVFPLRLLPVGLYDRLADFFGVTRTMDDFRGRD